MRNRTFMALVFLLCSAAVIGACTSSSRPKVAQARSTVPPATRQSVRTAACEPPFPSPPSQSTANLQPGSNPSAVPADVLIADNHNNRLVVVDPRGNVVWTFPNPTSNLNGYRFAEPDDAFFTPDGCHIVVTEEDFQVVSIIDIASNSIVWRYGHEDTPGNSPGYLDNPDDAIELPGNYLVLADIKNCSVLFLNVASGQPFKRIGLNTNGCLHDPPARFGSPNGAFPLSDGNLLVTEINGSYVDEMTTSGKILWSVQLPGIAYPSDSNEVSPGVYVTVDYSYPGHLIEFNQEGQVLWSYSPSSPEGVLNHPSLCLPIPQNGDFICNDDRNHRVIVIDPKTSTIVWQYGHTGVPGSAPGFLNNPDGLDLAPPYSLEDRFYSRMQPPSPFCDPSVPQGSCTIGP